MDGVGPGGGVDLASLAYRQNEEAKHLQERIARCIEAPLEVVELFNFGTGAADLPGRRRAVVIACANGRQYRVGLNMPNARKLAEELSAPHPEESTENGAQAGPGVGEQPPPAIADA